MKLSFKAGRFLVLLLLVASLGACNLVPAALEPAAVKYYNYMQGLTPGKSYSSFTSPAYRQSLSKETQSKLDDVLSRSRKKNPRAIEARPADVRVAVDGIFGLTAAGAEASFAAQALGETRWVKAGGRWYLYLNSDAEISAYGQFPSNLRLPAPEQAKRDDPDAPQ